MSQVKYIPEDKLFYKGMFVTVIGNVMTGGKLVYAIIDSNGVIGSATEYGLEGIPLTEEILSKNGWRKSNNGDHYCDNGNGSIRIGQNQFKDIKFVHQL